MTVSTAVQTERPGSLAAPYRDALDQLLAASAPARLARRDASLWTDDAARAASIANRLGWIDLPAWVAPRIGEMRSFAQAIRDDGLTRVLLLGMGGSSLAPEVLQKTLRAGPGTPSLAVLDSTDPAAIRHAAEDARLDRTFFLVSSKSGSTIETRSQYRHFRGALEAAGVAAPGGRFAAVTDPGSPLEALAAKEGFRALFRNPADVGGRYSALSYFGMVPAAILGLDLDALARWAAAARAEAVLSDPAGNGALRLGAFLAGAARAGRDKLTLLAAPSIQPLGAWIEQLVAESTGKEGRGVIPIEGEPLGPLHHYGDDRAYVFLALSGEAVPDLDRLELDLAGTGAPCVRIELPDPQAIAGEFVRWEAATAFAGASFRIDPFDEPNVQESKDATHRLLAAFAREGRFPEEPARAEDGGVTVFAREAVWEAVTAALPAHASLELVLQRFFALARPDDYLALLAYMERTAESGAAFEGMRRAVRNALRLPVLLGYGPRYLHSIGQLYKGGPASGLFLVLTADPEPGSDVPVPDAGYTFGELIRAQALGDLESLAAHDKPALRLHLGRGVSAGLTAVHHAVERALAARV